MGAFRRGAFGADSTVLTCIRAGIDGVRLESSSRAEFRFVFVFDFQIDGAALVFESFARCVSSLRRQRQHLYAQCQPWRAYGMWQ